MGQSAVIPKYTPRPKPAAVHVTRDGREICSEHAAGKREYDRRKKIMWLRQLKRCGICRHPTPLEEGQFGHGHSRGMGGGFRDDRIWDDDGNPLNAFLCGKCNSEQGSKRYEWREGVFQAVERIRA